MDWLTGGKQGEAKRLITQLADVTKRDSAAQDLIRLGADAVPTLIEALQTKDLSLLPIYEQILARIPSASPTLTKILATAHPILRARIADIFAINKDKSAVPALLDALHGEYFTVRARAALALAKIGEPKAIQPLLKALKDPEAEVRSAASWAYSKTRPRLMRSPIFCWMMKRSKCVMLQRRLYDMHHEVGKASAEALAQFGVPSLDILIEALSHPEMWIRIHSIQALATIKDSRIAPVLLQMLNDPEREVKKQVIESMGVLKDKSILPALQAIVANRADREFHALAKQVIEKLL